MQPFDLPEFYVPYPPRLNPRLEPARQNSKTWAYEMGFLDGEDHPRSRAVWSERKFDTMDFALFCAYVWPDASGPELDLLTEWTIWAFAFDDSFDAFERGKDLTGAQEWFARLLAFMPTEPTATPAPTDVMQRGLTDLWPRIMRPASPDWRRRFATDVQDCLREPLYRLARLTHGRTVDPVEYIGMRRKDGGALWAADMVEHAAGTELPARIVLSRPIQILRDTFADAVHLLNDIFSYQREAEEETGAPSNSVLLTERFLGCTPQQAADVVNDLLNSRLHQFENTVVAELPVLYEENRLRPAERLDVLRYIRGLQEWYSGSYEWHKRSSRYADPSSQVGPMRVPWLAGPIALGTSAVHIGVRGGAARRRGCPAIRLGVDDGRTQPVEPPDFYMPFQVRLNPDLETIRRHATAWAEQMGMFDWPSGFATPTVWNRPAFDRMDLGLFVALRFPEATDRALDLVTEWTIWTVYLDDFFLKVFKRGHNLPAATAYMRRLMTYLSEPSLDIPAPTDPVQRGLKQVWARTRPNLPEDARRRFIARARGFLDTFLWELGNLVQSRLPDPVDYMEMRRRSVGARFEDALGQYVTGQDLPAEFLAARPMRMLSDIIGDVYGIYNDIFSYRREIEEEDETHNGLLVLRRTFDWDLDRAVGVLNNLATARLHEFEGIVAFDLPALLDEHHAQDGQRTSLHRYIEAVQTRLAGFLRWHSATGRYRSDETRYPNLHRLLAGPTGLGTSAVRLPTPEPRRDR
ncbi:terpene synthase family protein [Allorhizocola rhizosphaerae]|uniref:terpene synthase family protein n=1 Tax=Allorhizocola rhizosphaerae TaxID=1872709 RepID=UPI000E3DEADC|nr:germacradienol/geosmin synthase [Allorhizocola rhizosphaerae]